MAKITARKFGGNDSASWAIFRDGKPVITGLTKSEVPYWRARVEAKEERRGDKSD